MAKLRSYIRIPRREKEKNKDAATGTGIMLIFARALFVLIISMLAFWILISEE